MISTSDVLYFVYDDEGYLVAIFNPFLEAEFKQFMLQNKTFTSKTKTVTIEDVG